MPLPKKQHSRSRSRKRRTHWKFKLTGLSPCPQCRQPIISHRVCPFCGFYNGKQVVEIKPKKEKKKQ